jgi:hypothetical protein
LAFKGYDLIGDIHGCSETLRILLDRLGYRLERGVYRHPQRRVIFLGDIVDRGPHIRETYEIVRAMVEAGEAEIVIGNHEYNYLCYRTENPDKPGTFLREHTPRHQRIVQETLDQFANYQNDERDMLSWIMDMPLFIEKDDLRVVHACWHSTLIKRLQTQVPSCPRITKEFLYKSAVPNSFEFLVMDRLTRGTHLRLPNNEVMVSKDGFRRHFFRTKFWSREPQFMGDVVFQPDPLPEHIARTELTPADHIDLQHYGPEERALFIGHYWCEGEPKPVADNIACLDYSAVKYGKLVAYRFDGERELDSSKFVWVDVNAEFPRMPL